MIVLWRKTLEIAIFIVIILFFFGYPTLGIFQKKITMNRFIIVYLDKTPVTFWCSIGMMYCFGITLLSGLHKLPFSQYCIPILMVFIVIYLIIYFLKW